MSDNPRHSVSVAAVIVDEAGRVLVIRRRDNGKWEPPGGVLELDEAILEGLQREVLEETGLVVEPERLTGVYKNMTKGVVALVFRAHVRAGELRTTDETVDAAWLDRRQVAERLDEAYAVRVLDALDAPSAVVRVHDGAKLLAREYPL